MALAASRTIALVTGASGGIGRAAARRLGERQDLFLADIAAPPLNTLAEELRGEGMIVRGVQASDLGEAGAAAALVGAARAAGPLGAVVHAAGLSPALARGDAILRTNVLATEQLLRALEGALAPGFVAILIASVAGHTPLPAALLDILADDPLDPHFATRAAEASGGTIAPPLAYCLSKRWVIRAAEARSAAWGQAGARIVSISPGLIDTPMGRAEIATTPGTQQTLDMTPLGWGRPDDIAAAAAFLCSADARFITGCDLLVDGGVLPVFKAAIAA